MHFCFKNGTPVFFADDTNVLIAHLNFNTLMKMGNEELKNLNDWLITNKLILNSKKTKVIVFRSRGKSIPETNEVLNIAGDSLEIVSNTTFLGLHLNEHLNWKNHMIDLQTNIRQKLAIVSKVKKQLHYTALLKIYHSLINGKVKYCISSWCFGNKTVRNTLQRTCNNFFRMIFGLRWTQSVVPLFYLYKIPTITHLLVRELANIMHKYHSGTLPSSLCSFFTKTTLNVRTRSGSEVSRSSFKNTLSQQAISFRAIQVWNMIPNHIKFKENTDPDSIIKNLRPQNNFISLLDEYLFQNSEAFSEI